MTITLTEAIAAVRRERANLDQVGPLTVDQSYFEHLSKWRSAAALAADNLAREGAAVGDKGDGIWRIRFAGVAATSTAGISNALSNWLAAAARKHELAGGDHGQS